MKMKSILLSLCMGITSLCSSQWNGTVIHINGCNDMPSSFSTGDSVYFIGSFYYVKCDGIPIEDFSYYQEFPVGFLIECTQSQGVVFFLWPPDNSCSGWTIVGQSSRRLFPIINNTGFKEITNTDFKMSPNPATDNLTIQVKNRSRFDVFSTSGNLLMSTMMNAGSNTVNVSDLPIGVYVVKVDNVSKQLIKL